MTILKQVEIEEVYRIDDVESLIENKCHKIEQMFCLQFAFEAIKFLIKQASKCHYS